MRSVKTYTVLGILAFMVLATSCKIQAPILRSDISLPGSFGFEGDSMNIGKEAWYSFYSDSLLRDLIDEGVQKNFDRRIGNNSVQLFMSKVSMAESAFLPFVNAGFRGTVDKYGEYTMNGIGNDDTNRSESLPSDKVLPNPYPELFAGITFGWEADLWGKLASRKKAALSRYLASNEMRHGITSFMIYRIASDYFELLGLDQRKSVLNENITLQELALEMVRIQKDGGKVNQLAVDQFESQLLHTRGLFVQVEQDIFLTEARLNQTLGRFPAKIPRGTIEDYDQNDNYTGGRPDDLIFNRPDLREMEFNLQAANADVASARAAFYPSLSLTGAAGLSSLNLLKLFELPGAAAYSIGSGLTAPILQRKYIKSLFDQSKTHQRIALLNYDRTLLHAYYEVYGVLNTIEKIRMQSQLKQKEVEVQRRAVNSSNDLFSVGFATYLEVITAQRRLLEVELELSDLKTRKLQSEAILYRALGGGWAGVPES